MNRKKVFLFVGLIGGGVLLVWALGVSEGESLLGGRRFRKSEPTTGPEPFPTKASSDVALKNAEIPVREPSKDDPNVQVLRYVIHIGETVGDLAKRTHAKKVLIEIYNKKPKPDERMVAKVKGDDAELDFSSAPDAAAGFRDAAIETMSLNGHVAVDYLDDQGASQARLEAERLEVTDEGFKVPGRALVTQEGMRVEGDGLIYHRVGGAFSFEKNVHVEGTQFGLPTPNLSGSGAAPVAKTLKSIDCDGRLTFVPDEKKGAKKSAKPSADPSAIPTREEFGSMSGGVLTFHDRVIGKQEDSTLLCEVLEITLGSPPEPAEPDAGAAKKKSRLQVEHAVATGIAGKPAVMEDPQGRLQGMVLILDKAEGGQVVVMQQEARIIDAKMGGAPGSTKLLNAGALTEIRFHPQPREADAPSDSPQVVRLELKDDAWLETKGAQPSDDLRVEGQRLDLEFAKSGGKGASGGSMQLKHLTATGAAKGVIPQGTFTGDEIVVAPRPGAKDAQDFQIDIQPNPCVELVSDLPSGGQREVKVTSTGKLTYLPAEAAGQTGTATFFGATNLTVKENGAISSTLDCSKSLTIELGGDAGGDALKGMVAEGDVHFDSPRQRIKGVGDRMRLEPGEKDAQTFRLFGAPAVATAVDSNGKENVVEAMSIEFDPGTGRMYAQGADPPVKARVVGIALGPSGGGAATPASAEPGVLFCEDLEVFAPADGGPITLIAKKKVRFLEPGHNLTARCEELHYDQATKIATFDGPQSDPAEVTRSEPATADQGERSVTVAGPRIILETEINVLTCPVRGRVTLVRDAAPGDKAKDQVVSAWSSGPVRYVNDRLMLRDDVVVAFDEDGREQRSLRSDVATVYFADRGVDAAADAGANAGLSSVGGVDRIVAEGRVHLEQKLPQELIADGQTLEWIATGAEETMILVGSSPQSTVIQKMGDRRLRYDADRFVMHKGTEEIQADNGRVTFID